MEKAGQKIPCKRCGGTAKIILNNRRYFVFCPICQFQCLLKEFNTSPEATQSHYSDFQPKVDVRHIEIKSEQNKALFDFKIKSPYEY